MKVSFFVHNLAENPIVRIYPIAKAFEAMGWETEVLGFLFGGAKIYEPYKDSLDYKTLRIKPTAISCFQNAENLAAQAAGDIIYSGKPLITSFLPALKASGEGKAKPLLLDIEDNDVEAFRPTTWLSYLKAVKNINSPGAYFVNHWLKQRASCCCATTVSSSRLKTLYGGNILLHGPPDLDSLVPIGSKKQDDLRSEFGLPKDKLLLLFAGKARHHKGVRQAVDALRELNNESITLVLAGDPTQPDFEYAKSLLSHRVLLMGFVGQEKIQSLTQASDIGLVLQNRNEYTKSQVPAKLLESFANGRPVISTSVGDLPDLLGVPEGASHLRGWVLDDLSQGSIRKTLLEVYADWKSDGKAISYRGLEARRFHLARASTDANKRLLSQILPTSCI